MTDLLKRARDTGISLTLGLSAIFLMHTAIEKLHEAGLIELPKRPPSYKGYPIGPKPEMSQKETEAGCAVTFESIPTASPFTARGWIRVCKAEPGV